MTTRTAPRPVSASRLTGYQLEAQTHEGFRLRLAQWFGEAAQCRVDLAFGADSSAHHDLQRGLLTSLVAYGEWAQRQARREKIDLSAIGVKVEDIAAETRLLRDTFRSAFDNALSSAEADAVLKEVFG